MRQSRVELKKNLLLYRLKDARGRRVSVGTLSKMINETTGYTGKLLGYLMQDGNPVVKDKQGGIMYYSIVCQNGDQLCKT